jgi:hypothetical protein
MKFKSFLTEQTDKELLSAFEDTINYCENVQKRELPTRDAIQFLAGRCKQNNIDVSKFLDKLLKVTK